MVICLLIPIAIYLKTDADATQPIAQTTPNSYTHQLISTKGSNIQTIDYSDLAIQNVKQIYNVSTQEKIQNKLLQLTQSAHATFSQPLCPIFGLCI